MNWDCPFCDPLTVSVSVSDASHRLIEANAAPGKSFFGGVKLPDGRWGVDLDADVYHRLQAIDPDVDRAIAQLCSTGAGNA